MFFKIDVDNVENGTDCIDNKGCEKFFATQEHKFHNYVIIIHSSGSKPVHVVHFFGFVTGPESMLIVL